MTTEHIALRRDDRDNWDKPLVSGLFACPTFRKSTGTTGTAKPPEAVSRPTRPTCQIATGTADNGVKSPSVPLVPPVPAECNIPNEDMPPELAAWDGTHPTDVHRRAFPSSTTRPGCLERLPPDVAERWQEIVTGSMYYAGRTRRTAEGIAWAHLEKHYGEDCL